MKNPDLGVSPITGTIFAGKSKPSKLSPKLKEWIGEKHDITDDAVRAVFEHMMHNAQETGYYGVTFAGFGTMEITLENRPEATEPTESA